MLSVGDKAPEFNLNDQDGNQVQLKDFSGKKTVIYFYPKDQTPGCIKEACNFRDNIEAYKEKGIVVLGVSIDSEKSHLNFKAKQDFNFDLLSDEDESLCKQFDVIKLKKLYGKEYMGIDRSTFLIDEKAVLIKEWRGVKVKDHVEEVLAACKEAS